MEAEYYALAEGLRIAANRSESRAYCTAYTDVKPLVRKMRGTEPCRDDWADYRVSCHWLLNKFDEWELKYCKRESNEDAHNLARLALKEGRDSNP